MEKKKFISEIDRYKKILNIESFDDFLSGSVLYNYLKDNKSLEFLDEFYSLLFLYGNLSFLDNNALDEIIKSLVPTAQKHGAEGSAEEIDNEYNVSFATSVNMVVKFVKTFYPEYLKHFMDIMNNRFYITKEKNSVYNSVLDSVSVYDSNSIATCYVLIHELIHSENGGDTSIYNWTSEVPSYAIEFFFNDFIKGYYKKLIKDSNLWMRARLADDVETLCGYIFMKKFKKLIDDNNPVNKDSINELLGSITSEFGIHEVYVISSVEKFFYVVKSYEDAKNSVEDEEIKDITVKEYKKTFLSKHEKGKAMRDALLEGNRLVIKCSEHAIGSALGFKLYQNMFDNDFDTEEFININANIHNLSVDDLLNILSLKDKNGYNKDELNNMKEAFQMRLKRLEDE